MKQTIIDIDSYVLIVFALAAILLGINSCDSSGGANSERFLYTSSNDSAGNTIIVLSIDQKGQLSQIGNVPTEGVGDANEGDFDAQHSLHIIPGTNYLLAVNAGDSIEEVGIYKPDYKVYDMPIKKYQIKKNEVTFLSANTWDVSGGGNYGFNSIWVNRNNNIFDNLDYKPKNEIKNLEQLNNIIKAS